MFGSRQGRMRPAYDPPAPQRDRHQVQRSADRACAWHRLATSVPVSRPDDASEREADRVADAVVRGDSAPIGPVGSSGIAHVDAGPAVQRRCAACEEEDPNDSPEPAQVHRRSMPGHPAPPGSHATAAPAQPIADGGKPLSAALRADFEPRLGVDLSRVRIHTGPEAVASARRFQARAYTFGSHIVFGSGGLDPDAPADRHLLAHELTHTLQQSGGGAPRLQRQPDGREKTHDWTEDWWPPHFKPEFPESPIEPPGTQDLVEGCKKAPWIPGCKQVCGLYGCGQPPSSQTLCPPGFHGSTTTDFKDQCCKDGPADSAQVCCPKDRMGDGRCCVPGEVPVGGHCVKGEPVEPKGLCPPPGRKSPSGDCCLPPKVPGDWGCEEGKTVEPPKPLMLDAFVDRFTVLFKQDQPRPGQAFEDALAGGRSQLDQAIDALKKDLATGAQLVANASKEGEPDYNLDLTDRRLAAVRTEMKDVTWKLRDPIPPLANTQGCRGSWGAYSCGGKNADPEALRAGDRNVQIRLFRPTGWPLPPWSPTQTVQPPMPWTWPGKPILGPFR